MPATRDWRSSRKEWMRLLEERTGAGVDAWNQRISDECPADESALRSWLRSHGVTGYAQSLLVRERFGYPDYLVASATELIERQYADRLHLRRVLDALVDAAMRAGNVVVQARKT